MGRTRTWTSLLVPLRCPGCGTADEVVCPGCREAVLRGPVRLRPLADGTLAVASAPWRGPARGLVVAAKESGRRDVGDVLALAVARAVVRVVWGEQPGDGTPGGGVPAGPAGTVLLVPPPARAWAVVRRGSRPTADLARASARVLRAAGADVRAVELLGHTRRVRDQAGLTRLERAENLDGAFVVRRGTPRLSPYGTDVVVVDDVMTTGATVLQCTRALREGGLVVRGAALVASA